MIVFARSHSLRKMFQSEGYAVTDDASEADALALPGGADIHPSLYNQVNHPTCYATLGRDDFEVALIDRFVYENKPIMGICRGAQLLCAMAGGSLYQDVNNHGGLTDHGCVDTRTGRNLVVNSLHHQMCRPPETAQVLAVASESTRREYMDGRNIVVEELDDIPRGTDVEAVWYPSILGLGVQWHPEMAGSQTDSRRYFFELIEEFVLPLINQQGNNVCAAS